MTMGIEGMDSPVIDVGRSFRTARCMSRGVDPRCANVVDDGEEEVGEGYMTAPFHCSLWWVLVDAVVVHGAEGFV